jgi:hypothetical protein
MSSLLEQMALEQSKLRALATERAEIINLLRETVRVLAAELTEALTQASTRGATYCHYCGAVLEEYVADGTHAHPHRAQASSVYHATTCAKSPLAAVVTTARAAFRAYLDAADEPERFQQAMQNIRHTLEALDAVTGRPDTKGA